MADTFKKTMDSHCGGVGGVKCDCCNDFKGKSKGRLRRTARRIIKQADVAKFREYTG